MSKQDSDVPLMILKLEYVERFHACFKAQGAEAVVESARDHDYCIRPR